jgi:hypothetical protein
MWRDDPIKEPWYELDFQMKRWQCPTGLPSPLLEDVIEAIREMDRILLDSMKLVDRYSYGWESSQKRYIRHSVYETFRGEFEQAEDGLLVARHGLAARWASILSSHQQTIASLPTDILRALEHPEVDYTMSYSVTDVELNDNLKQFLEGVQPGKEQMVLPRS